jgi:hypothetical protein
MSLADALAQPETLSEGDADFEFDPPRANLRFRPADLG